MKKFTLFLMLLVAAVTTAMAQSFSEANLKTLTVPGNYYVYHTDANGVKHYLQIAGADNVTTVTENPEAFEVAEGIREDQHAGDPLFSKSYLMKMKGTYISNTGQNATNIKTDTEAKKWTSQVAFVGDNGKCAIRLTNSSVQDTWHGHYFINLNENYQPIGADPSLADALYLWEFEEKDLYAPYKTGDRATSATESSYATRQITAVTVNETTIQNPSPEQLYVDLTSESFNVTSGEQITVSLTHNNVEWMHSYIYVDFDGDGFQYIEGETMPLGDLVSYSYKGGKNSDNIDANAGTSINAIPSFTAPANPGTYRMRYKMAYDNFDPNGNAAWVGDAGTIIDFTLIVSPVSSEPREVSAAVQTDGTGSVTINGENAESVNVAGAVTLVATPANGYKFVKWLDGETIVSTNATYTYTGNSAKAFVAVFEKKTIDEKYAEIEKPTFVSGGNMTTIAQIKFNGKNLTGFSYGLGAANKFNEVLKVRPGETCLLTVGYELHWGNISLAQIDKNGENVKYGSYICQWEDTPNPDPLTILERDNGTVMCEDFGLESFEGFEKLTDVTPKYIWLPYEVTIAESQEPGDLVVVRLVVANPAGGTATTDYGTGGCLDILFEVVDESDNFETGKYYALKNAHTNRYLSNEINTTLKTVERAGVNTIYYAEESEQGVYFMSYQNGNYIANPWRIGIGDETIPESSEKYKQSWNAIYEGDGKYLLKYGVEHNAYYFTCNGTESSYTEDATAENALWTLEEVTSLPVTITDVKYATFHAPVEVTISEADAVTAHTVTINGNGNAELSEAIKVIPANTPVILYADITEDATYEFAITTTGADAISGSRNKLVGTLGAKKTLGTDELYVLANVGGNVGLYKANTTNGFTLKGHAAYLPASAVPAEAASSVGFRFDFATTAIEEVKGENGAEAIYDLQGRRIDEITEPGIYIVNGVKRVVR